MEQLDIKPRAKRGFACMPEEKRKAISRKGGASVPGHKRSFAKDQKLAATAGRKGGQASLKAKVTPVT